MNLYPPVCDTCLYGVAKCSGHEIPEHVYNCMLLADVCNAIEAMGGYPPAEAPTPCIEGSPPPLLNPPNFDNFLDMEQE